MNDANNNTNDNNNRVVLLRVSFVLLKVHCWKRD